MSSKVEKIIKIAHQAGDSDDVEVITSTFKARGKLLKDDHKFEKGIVTLKDVKVSPLFAECACADCYEEDNWLNIFEDQIISFTVYK